MTGPDASSAARATPAVSLVVIAIGPERVIARAFDTALRQDAPSAELLVVHDRDDEAAHRRLDGYLAGRAATFVAAPSASPGAARNAGVRRSGGACFLVIDGSEALPSDHVSRALRALDAAPGAGFAAASGAPLFGGVRPGPAIGEHIDIPTLAAGAWTVGTATIRREPFDRAGGFDEALPALSDWDLLLTLAGAGHSGVLLGGGGSRYGDDDVRLRESLGTRQYLPAARRIVGKHQRVFEEFMRPALVERERLIRRLFEYERTLLDRRQRAMGDLTAATRQIAALRPTLAQQGMRSLDFADLRRTAPVSRHWGSDRGLPVDRHYIHRFLAEQAHDVRGHVLEMLDGDLTAAYGGDRVDRSDVLDIDSGNTRATIVADLRVAEQLPADTYDCFILTQTLHLIDDMPAALRSAYRSLKPGGVLLATLPCASMVAAEYGAAGDHWRVTEAGARALFERVFSPGHLTIRAYGNVLTTTAFLYGLCCEDLDPEELAVDDPAYPLLITVRARKPDAAARQDRATPRAPDAAVLLYHRVADVRHDVHGLAVSSAAFRSQLAYLRDSWSVLPLSELVAAAAAGAPPDRAIALTFDDGYLDNLEVVAPMLVEYGVPVTFFLTSETPDRRRRYWWDALEEMLLLAPVLPPTIELTIGGRRRSFETADPSTRRAVHDELHGFLMRSAPVVRDHVIFELAQQTSMSVDSDVHRPMLAPEIHRLCTIPRIDIGAHGVHHLSLPHLSPEECHREVFESRSALERLTGRTVTSFAYPFGAISPDVVTSVMAAGFDVAVDCASRALRAREHRLRIPRLATREESAEQLDARLQTLMRRSLSP